jgi:hypothetical protein
VWPLQTPRTQKSFPSHKFESVQGVLSGRGGLEHVPPLQRSSVQGFESSHWLPSVQFPQAWPPGFPTQTPPVHSSDVVQLFPSSQGRPEARNVWAQRPEPSQVSLVHGFPSSRHGVPAGDLHILVASSHWSWHWMPNEQGTEVATQAADALQNCVQTDRQSGGGGGVSTFWFKSMLVFCEDLLPCSRYLWSVAKQAVVAAATNVRHCTRHDELCVSKSWRGRGGTDAPHRPETRSQRSHFPQANTLVGRHLPRESHWSPTEQASPSSVRRESKSKDQMSEAKAKKRHKQTHRTAR